MNGKEWDAPGIMPTDPRSDGIVDVPAIIDDRLIDMAAAAERRVDAILRIKAAALRVTNKRDWVDQNGSPYLQASGAEKVARLFGISWRIDEPDLTTEPDGHYSYTYKGHFRLGSAEIEAIGARSSRDPFFSRRRGPDGKSIELSPEEIDRNNIKKSALTNCLANGITRLLGIRNLSWEELAAFGITQESVSHVEYNKPEMAEDAQEKRADLRRMCLEMAAGEEAEAKILLEGFTAFVAKDGKAVRGKRTVDEITEKAIYPTHKRVAEAYKKWRATTGVADNGTA